MKAIHTTHTIFDFNLGKYQFATVRFLSLSLAYLPHAEVRMAVHEWLFNKNVTKFS